ncbi:MAG: hypothetical protein ACRCWF_15380 [Beijerinckiaceae bacterium]
MKRIALVALGLVSGLVPAAAQYYPYPPQRPHYYEPPPRPYYRQDPYGWDAPRYRPVVVGNICYTSRGSCRTRPAPEESPCRCDIPGFGLKRGAIVARPQW